MRTGMTFGLFAALLLAPAVRTHAEEPVTQINLAQELARLNNTLKSLESELKTESVRGANTARIINELKERVDHLESTQRSGGLSEQLNDLTGRVQRLEATQRSGAGSEQLNELASRVQQLEVQVANLANSRGPLTTSGYYTPSAPRPLAPVPAPAARSVVHLENRYNVPVTVYLNGRGYSVPAYEAVEVPVPPGLFTYEVSAEGFGVIQAPVTRTLPAGGTHNIYVNPPATVAALP